jgi:hypothetical protein
MRLIAEGDPRSEMVTDTQAARQWKPERDAAREDSPQ